MQDVKKRARWLVPLTAAAVLLAACGGGSDNGGGGGGGGKSKSPDAKEAKGPKKYEDGKQGGELVFGADQEPDGGNFNINTSGGNSTASQNIVGMIYPNAFLVQPDFSVTMNEELLSEADITATSPKQVVTYKIKPEAVWDDGSPISADDFSYMWEHLNGTNTDYDVSGTAGYDQVESVTGSDGGKTVTVTFSKPYADWKGLFSLGGILQASKMKTLSGGDDVKAWNEGLTGAIPFTGGPFKLESFTADTSTVLVPNDKYYGKKPYLDRITYRLISDSKVQPQALQNGEVNMIYPQPQLDLVNQVKSFQGVKSEINFGLVFEHLDFNTKNEFLGDVKVRKAIAKALDREAILNSGIKQFSDKAEVLNNRIWLTNQPEYKDTSGGGYDKVDLEASNKLMEEAGYTKGGDGIYAKDGKPISLRFTTTPGNALREQTGVLFQQQMQKAGITVVIDNDKSIFSARLPDGNFDVALFAWVGSPFTISGSTAIYKSVPDDADAQSNYGRLNDPKIDMLFDQANAELDPKKLVDLGNEIDTQLWEDMVSIPLYQKATFLAYSDSYGNISDNPTQLGPLWDAQYFYKK